MLTHRRLIVFASCIITVLTSLLAAFAQSRATLTLSSPTLAVGESGIVEARLDCGDTECTAFAVTLLYDPTLMRVDDIELGSYLGEAAFVAAKEIDQESGELHFAATALGSPAVVKDALLFTLTITGLDAGQTQLSAFEVEIGDFESFAASVRGGMVRIEAPIPTRTPVRSTPTPQAPTLTPATLSPGVRVSRPRSVQDGVRYMGLWSELEFQDISTPGIATYDLVVDANQTYRWVFTWCGSRTVRLSEVLEPFGIEMRVDGDPITSVLEYSVPNCRGWMALLSDWEPGRTITLDIVYTLSASVFDGQKRYGAGEYVQRIYATAR